MLTRAVRTVGFTLLEVVVTMAIFAILTALAVPSMRQWVTNGKIRAVADSLQNGLRLAQSEAVRRSRRVVFSLTNSPSPSTSLTAVANGINWSINTIPSMTDGSETAASSFVESGAVTTASSSVQVTGQAAICFNSIGRLISNNTTGVKDAICSLPNNPPVFTYNVTVPSAIVGADRPLNVTVALGGQVHMCDPAKTLSSANPDGC